MGKKRKCYFNQDKSDAKKFKFSKLKLAPNMKGFLITYNCKFTFCVNEAKKLIDQFSAKNQDEVLSLLLLLLGCDEIFVVFF